MKKFAIVGCKVLWRELTHFASLTPHRYEFRFLEQGLHNTPPELRAQLQDAINDLPDDFDAVLLGYGLCSNGLLGIEARKTPLVVPRAHDCITFLLGSKERYREYFDSHPGTYWYSPGWIEETTMPGKDRYERLLEHYKEVYGEENAEYLMEMEQTWMQNYNNCAYVDLGFGDSSPHQDYTRECAEYLGWNTDFLRGDPQLIRRFLEGEWNEEDFLVVRAGERIVPSHDDRVLKAVPAEQEQAAS
jgi:hypothetical protein